MWELKNVGNTKMYKIVGKTKNVGSQNCWEIKNVRRIVSLDS